MGRSKLQAGLLLLFTFVDSPLQVTMGHYHRWTIFLGEEMTIKDAATKSGLSLGALYKQIREGRALGRYFTRDSMGRWVIDARKVKGSK